MNTKLLDTAIGGSGIGASILVENAQMPDMQHASGIVSAVVQLLIAVITLVGLFRPRKAI